ncbi:hypothetical protein TNCT_373611 [Trichonephila clavata]|uniref:Uncharacterized protein n=1 Tax=Trichonephila clavata TaxID=2740835 RepID=A0A8X6FTE4_TRICU|nr:hypothetical protein TNCT_373611 [Trichonephila clavata]
MFRGSGLHVKVLDRNENPNINSSQIKPGLSFAQALTPIIQHQMATPVSESSASEKPAPNKNTANNKATANVNPIQDQEFSIFHAIIELQNIFNLFPALLPEMKKSYNSPNPADKLGCLIKGICSSLNNININNE